MSEVYPQYYSTRDAAKTQVSFEEALLAGLAPDGGLYVPTTVPEVPDADWRDAATFDDLAVNVLGHWLAGEIGAATLANLVRDALDFPVPVVLLGDDVGVLELFHGPTLSFKDFGARTMARLMSHFLARRGERLTILVATSGDTGSAVADGFAGQDNIDVVLLYPKGKVSDVQERQLIVARPGVRAFAVEGSFDDCQRLVKAAFVDPELAHLPLSSANSINIGRLLPQSLYYLWAARSYETAPLICVPSGNLGNLTGGVLASRMGLGVPRFLVAHNANDFFPRYLDARAEAYAFRDTVATLSNAMDVGAPSNFERLDALVGAETMRDELRGSSISDEATRARMAEVYRHEHYLACPHTAVGLEAIARYRQQSGDDRPVLNLATAHPAKFPDAFREALGLEPPTDPALDQLWQQDVAVEPLTPSLDVFREVLLDTVEVSS
ncbi:MAG: threonine synthase [Trueperaceae bacterium]|nr:threonine synthase [Trueperaceae bacterium]